MDDDLRRVQLLFSVVRDSVQWPVPHGAVNARDVASDEMEVQS